jgi:hypothetical protein
MFSVKLKQPYTKLSISEESILLVLCALSFQKTVSSCPYHSRGALGQVVEGAAFGLVFTRYMGQIVRE